MAAKTLPEGWEWVCGPCSVPPPRSRHQVALAKFAIFLTDGMIPVCLSFSPRVDAARRSMGRARYDALASGAGTFRQTLLRQVAAPQERGAIKKKRAAGL